MSLIKENTQNNKFLSFSLGGMHSTVERMFMAEYVVLFKHASKNVSFLTL